jgi:hypothetical protein
VHRLGYNDTNFKLFYNIHDTNLLCYGVYFFNDQYSIARPGALSASPALALAPSGPGGWGPQLLYMALAGGLTNLVISDLNDQ